MTKWIAAKNMRSLSKGNIINWGILERVRRWKWRLDRDGQQAKNNIPYSGSRMFDRDVQYLQPTFQRKGSQMRKIVY